MFVGEIGIKREQFLYTLPYWELHLMHRGYTNRSRNMWSAVRWQTYNIMCCSMKDITQAGIYSPRDLLHFPWERTHVQGSGRGPTADEIEKMRAEMRAENAAIENKRNNNPQK